LKKLCRESREKEKMIRTAEIVDERDEK